MYRPSFSFPEIIIDLSSRKIKSKVIVSGVALNIVDETRIVGIPIMTSKPVTESRIDYAQNAVITMIDEAYRTLYSETRNLPLLLSSALQSLEFEVDNGFRLYPSWKAVSTNRQRMTFFVMNTYKIIKPFLLGDQVFLAEKDRLDIKRQLVEITLKNSSKASRSDESAIMRMREADVILSNLYDRVPDLHHISLSEGMIIDRQPKTEQIKYLPKSVIQRFSQKLTELAHNKPQLVIFAILCLHGFRPAESAGISESSITFYDTFCIVNIIQQEYKDTITSTLKNKYSYRPVIISFWGSMLLKQILTEYPSILKDTDKPYVNSKNASAWVKNLLIECGATNEIIYNLADEVEDDDMDADCILSKDNNEQLAKENFIAKIGCYVLRRNFATIARSVMGLSIYETDRLLGHINKSHGPDLNCYDNQIEIALKMERYVFNPNYSLNPSISPLLSSNGRAKLIEFSEYILENNENKELSVHINIAASESGEVITIIYPEDNEISVMSSSTPKNWANIDRRVIGDTANEKNAK